MVPTASATGTGIVLEVAFCQPRNSEYGLLSGDAMNAIADPRPVRQDMATFDGDREVISDRLVYFNDLEEAVREEIRGLIKRYSDLLPECERLVVTRSPLPAGLTGEKLFWTQKFDRGPKPFTGLYITERWESYNAQQRRYEFAMSLQFQRWDDEGIVSVDEEGVRLDLEDGLLTGEAAADHLNRVARSFMARAP